MPLFFIVRAAGKAVSPLSYKYAKAFFFIVQPYFSYSAFPFVVSPELDEGANHERTVGPSILRHAQDAGRTERRFIFGNYFFAGCSI
jgi:hypothetical protein